MTDCVLLAQVGVELPFSIQPVVRVLDAQGRPLTNYAVRAHLHPDDAPVSIYPSRISHLWGPILIAFVRCMSSRSSVSW